MIRRETRTDRSGTHALAAAMTVALVAAAMSASAAATPALSRVESRTAVSESSAGRLMAAAVAVARDMFGVDYSHAIHASEFTSSLLVVPARSSTTIEASEWTAASSTLDERLLDLPPPIC